MSAVARDVAPKRGRSKTPLSSRIAGVQYGISMVANDIFLADTALGSNEWAHEFMVSAVRASLLEIRKRLETLGEELCDLSADAATQEESVK